MRSPTFTHHATTTCPYSVVPNYATLSGMETVSAVLADLGASAPDSKKNSASQNDVPKPAQGLVLGGGLPSVPAEILHRIHKNSRSVKSHALGV